MIGQVWGNMVIRGKRQAVNESQKNKKREWTWKLAHTISLTNCRNMA